MLLFTSIMVSMTLLVPMSPQSSARVPCPLMSREKIPQASEEPLSISDGATLALPLASSCTVMFWQRADGLTLSSMVAEVEQVEVLPLLSVTVRVTELMPTLEQSKFAGATLRLLMPQASAEPLSTWDASRVPRPEELS